MRAKAPQRQDIIRGKPLNYPAPVAMRYAAVLEQAVLTMTAETRREVEAIFRHEAVVEHFAQDASPVVVAKRVMAALSKRFDKLFASLAGPAATTMVDQADKSSAVMVGISIREMSQSLVLKTDFLTERHAVDMQASIADNVSLIKSIPEKYLDGVSGAVFRSITTGNGLQDLVPYLKKHGADTIQRARFIAHDQSRKAMTFLNRDRLIGLGMKKYEWLHSGGTQHPRELHVQMSGNIYSFDDPPVIDLRTGERGIPGQLINCHCRIVPVIEFA